MFKKLFGKTVDFKSLIKDGALVLDVRSKEEFGVDGLKEAVNIPLNELNHRVTELKEKQVPIICICAAGIRAAQAKKILVNNGIEAYNGLNSKKMTLYIGQ